MNYSMSLISLHYVRHFCSGSRKSRYTCIKNGSFIHVIYCRITNITIRPMHKWTKTVSYHKFTYQTCRMPMHCCRSYSNHLQLSRNILSHKTESHSLRRLMICKSSDHAKIIRQLNDACNGFTIIILHLRPPVRDLAWSLRDWYLTRAVGIVCSRRFSVRRSHRL